MNEENIFYATGKRKSAIARAWIRPGSGNITVNNKPIDKYFTVESAIKRTLQALTLTNLQDSVDVNVTVKGGGFTGQAGAIRHGITKALLEYQPDLRGVLKKAGYITRDPRVKERKKYGQKGARARFQFSKR
ncbi:SSU ribosomal protein S9P [Desulfatibacillum alkenivorans DSM 16219]|jgi:small subunit ribosomal protein S9|uniref:Small ribosomal subunit protein uS9 n=1 Tax=Desulfatibacillum alkenivorans DSM 16219 TaxID=1121393 RepID=A0A1M6LGH1_9BACT|nr:30S ribosomal protein S9 [Desulfatibacillum alkenivorans]SHJ70218.1 SSU ribosomal protein S9P [Desulfatibacillum alkenivorans DSM 16219]